jgi:hypothetical protein
MSFWVRYKATVGGAYTTMTLFPGPSEIDYPERRIMTVLEPADGGPVIQRPIRDTRTRRWTWTDFDPTIPTYENQWATLKQLEFLSRLENNLYPYVEVWEDVVDDAGFGRLDGGGAKIWTVVRFLKVDRTVRKGRGRLAYDQSYIEFVIDDVNWTGF